MTSTLPVILTLDGRRAQVRGPDWTQEDWPLASLPAGDLVRVTEDGGDVQLETEWTGSAHDA